MPTVIVKNRAASDVLLASGSWDDDDVPSDDDRAESLPSLNAAILLITLGRRAGERLDDRLRDLGLTYRHLSALGHLNREPGLSYSDLGRRVGVTAQSMQATIIHLQARRAVAGEGAGGRGRTAKLAVTNEGRALLASAMQAVSDTERDLLQRMPPHDREVLRDILSRLVIDEGPLVGDHAGPTRLPNSSTCPPVCDDGEGDGAALDASG